jgi:hypothetical protein
MAEETASAPPKQKRSVLPKLLLVVAAMLVVAVVVNWKNITDIASGRRTLKAVIYGKTHLLMPPTFRFPDPMGPEDAKVKAQIIAQEGNSCHEPLVGLWMGIGDLEPERLRVEFGWLSAEPLKRDGSAPETDEPPQEIQGPPDLGCAAGVLINGVNKFELGSGEEKRVIYLTEPYPRDPLGPEAAEGVDSPTGHEGWTLDDVATILNRAIEDEYGENPGLTGAAIQEAWDAAASRIPRVDETQGGAGTAS